MKTQTLDIGHHTGPFTLITTGRNIEASMVEIWPGEAGFEVEAEAIEVGQWITTVYINGNGYDSLGFTLNGSELRPATYHPHHGWGHRPILWVEPWIRCPLDKNGNLRKP